MNEIKCMLVAPHGNGCDYGMQFGPDGDDYVDECDCDSQDDHHCERDDIFEHDLEV